MRKVEERGERQKERKRRILTAEPLSFWVAEERKRRERKSQYRERERERERGKRGERREKRGDRECIAFGVYLRCEWGILFGARSFHLYTKPPTVRKKLKIRK